MARRSRPRRTRPRDPARSTREASSDTPRRGQQMESGPASPGRRAAAWASHLDQPEAPASKDQVVEEPVRLGVLKLRWFHAQPAEVQVEARGIENSVKVLGAIRPAGRGVLAQAFVQVSG